MRRERNLVYVSVGGVDDDEEPAVNISVPLARALMLRLRGPGCTETLCYHHRCKFPVRPCAGQFFEVPLCLLMTLSMTLS